MEVTHLFGCIIQSEFNFIKIELFCSTNLKKKFVENTLLKNIIAKPY